MAAANTDKFKKSYSFTQKTLNGSITDSDTTLTLNNTTNIPTDTAVSFVVDRVDSNGNLTPNTRELMTGVVSGSTITNLLRGEHGTTAQTHSSGAVVEFVNSGKAWNDLMDGILADHSQAGAHEVATNYDPSNPTLETQKWVGVSSAVNELTVTNAATGNPVKLEPTGGDSAIHLNLRGKGLAKSVTFGAGGITPFPYDYVVSGCVLSGDAYGSTLNFSMTSGVVVINGNPVTVASFSASAATASKDTYVDVLDNGDGTGLVVKTGGNIVNNNAASPALAANSIRIGIVVSGAGNIAAAASVNQGQEDRVLPIASSVPYAVTDSLGNLICPRDPNRKLLGYRQIITDFTTTSTSPAQLTGLTCPVIVPTGRKIKITFFANDLYVSGSTSIGAVASIWDGTVGSGTQLNRGLGGYNSSSSVPVGLSMAITTPSAASKTYNIGLNAQSAGTATVQAAATYPVFIKVELE